jgi:hypothetical protein
MPQILKSLAGEPTQRPKMLAVTIAQPRAPASVGIRHTHAARAVPQGAIEIEWNGARIVVNGAVDTQAVMLPQYTTVITVQSRLLDRQDVIISPWRLYVSILE